MNWLSALNTLHNQQQAYVLLTILNTRGSSPRGVGTKMVVSETECFDTIGGGALEYQCIEVARELLSSHANEYTIENSLEDSLQVTKTFNLGHLSFLKSFLRTTLFSIFLVLGTLVRH